MAVFTEISHTECDDWLKSHGLGELVSIEGIASGIENTNYFVDYTDAYGVLQHTVLTVFEKLSPTELPFYLGLVQHLAEHGIACPAPVMLRGGDLFADLKHKPAALMRKLPGQSTVHPNEKQCAAMGKVLAQMHLAGQSYPNHQPNARSTDWRNNTVPQLLPFIPSDLQKLLAEEMHYHQDKLNHYSALPQGAIHADLFRDNALMVGDELGGVFDFYFAAWDALLLDVAICVNDWCIDHATGEIDEHLYIAMITAYAVVRPFNEAEQMMWQSSLRLAALRFWISRLYDWYLPREASLVKPKEPSHFERILKLRQDNVPQLVPFPLNLSQSNHIAHLDIGA
jgi:homoserine kinase type II